jgi:hypothetical protein
MFKQMISLNYNNLNNLKNNQKLFHQVIVKNN